MVLKMTLKMIKGQKAIRLILGMLMLAYMHGSLFASNLQITGQQFEDLGGGVARVRFDIGWDDSWRVVEAPGNHDAAWVVLKFQRNRGGVWEHAYLDMNSLSLPPTVAADPGLLYPGTDYDATTNPGVGLMLYRSTPGSGRFEAKGLELLWHYGAAGLEEIGEFVDLRLIGVEMVYVPEGSYYLGSGGSESNGFASAEGTAIVVESEGELTTGVATLPASFPKGYGGFYCMKYEVNNGLYDLYLNSTGRSEEAGGGDPYYAAGNIGITDGLLLADWLVLRPMTELEYEKAARGSRSPVQGEYAWGDATIVSSPYSLSRYGDGQQRLSGRLSGTAGNAWYSSTASTGSPFRVGAFSDGGTNSRRSSGASYWGILELSGNVWESVVSAGTAAGLSFAGQHGDGNTGSSTFSGLESGIGLRGGSYASGANTLQISDRSRSNGTVGRVSGEVSDQGFRLVRTAESVSLPTVTTVSVTLGASNFAVGAANISSDGGSAVTSRGLVWSDSPRPTLTDSIKANGTGTGTFNTLIDIKNLDLATTYYVRAYATNGAGTAYGEEKTFTTPDYFSMVKVAGGTFEMGCTAEQGADCFPNESPVHEVTLSSYLAGKYEVSQLAWEWVMGSNPSYFSDCPECPVESVSWDDAQAFLMALNAKTGVSFRLPTEAEWEFAARGGNASQGYKYAGGNTLNSVGWYDDNATEPQISGQKTANELGLYDMTGNVWEWCSDYYGDYTAGAQTDPKGPGSGSLRVLRGGSYASLAIVARIPARYPTSSSYDDIEFGLRLFQSIGSDTLASVTTNAATDLTASGATISGEVTSNGSAMVTARGLVWSTDPNPDLSDEVVILGSGKGSFDHTLTGLTALTRYYVRAYATNAFGTVYGNQVVFVTTDGFAMKLVPGGTFTMGCTTEQGADCDADESPSHSVTVDSFMIGTYEVTQAQWTAIMGSNPSINRICPNCPVDGISWSAAQAFVDTINSRSDLTYRLPTEAEWEFAARGGGSSGGTKYSGSNTVGAVAWYSGNAGGMIQDVGGKQSNELGLYDMSGNVGEWVSDWYDAGYYSSSPASNPTGASSGTERVLRGGSHSSAATEVRTAARNKANPTTSSDGVGLRLARDVSLPVLTTTAVSSITDSTALSGGSFASAGNTIISSYGVVWGTSSSPTISGNKTVDGAGAETFSSTLTGLSGGTTYYVRAYAVHETGVAYGNEVSFATSAGLPAVTTTLVEVLSNSEARLGGEVTSDGGDPVTERGVVWNTGGTPTLSDNKIAIGTGTGSFSTVLDSLTANTTYYVRAYATNSLGTVYGSEQSFVTEVDLPELTTADLESFPDGSLFGGGTVLSDGGGMILSRGLVWSTSSGPDLADNFTVNGSGTGTFYGIINGLLPGTTYYIRAYATNSAGTGFGNEVSFTTSITLPEVETDLENIILAERSATVFGNVLSDGGSAVSSRGMVYGLSPSPDITGPKEEQGGEGIGHLDVQLYDLSPGATYYVRAYATNNAGTGYGEELSFTMPVLVPSVNLIKITSTGTTTAVADGRLITNGGEIVTELGFVWSTAPNPDFSDQITVGQGDEGFFFADLTNLLPGTRYYIRAYATNSAGTGYSEEQILDVPAQKPTLTTTAITNITGISATSGGKISSDGGSGITAKGVVWSTSSGPELDDNSTNTGSGAGSFVSTLTGLSTFTTYYVRAYATNSAGTGYGQERSFTTAAGLPTVTTGAISELTSSIASVSGEVVSDGGASVTLRGVVWSTTPLPDLSDFSAKAGSGTGIFSAQLSNLDPGTTYYVRAYAKNSSGTAYGSELTFTTAIAFPEVLTVGVTSVGVNRATVSGRVVSNGGGALSGSGVVWSTSPAPDLEDSIMDRGTAMGDFELMPADLTANTTYYVRAWATNEAGTAYGSQLTFTTLTELNLEMVKVVGGTFTMGCTGEQGSDCSTNEFPAHQVTLKDYFIGKYEITENDWIRVMGSLPTTASVCGTCPVTYVTWRNVQSFVAKLNEETGMNYRLLTEAEWEYAARGGVSRTGKKYAGSDDVDVVAWHSGSGVPYVQPVGQKAANELGLYDMSGNVWEWCSDYYGDYSAGSATNPTGPATGEARVLRGGAWSYPATRARVSSRGSGLQGSGPGFPNGFTGFRLAINTLDPEVTTHEVNSITDTSAMVVSEVVSQGLSGINERGVVWSQLEDPVLSDRTAHQASATVAKGNFSIEISRLTPFTTYYVRAYALNAQDTTYGEVLSFRTLPGLPLVTTKSFPAISPTSAIFQAEVISNQGAEILAQGLAWSLTPNPDITDNIALADTGSTLITVSLPNLSPFTRYYARAFATNSVGTAYGEEISFVTPRDFSGVSMVMVPGGTFTMGCEGSECRNFEKPAHQVTLDTFFMAQYEVTQAEWKAIIGNSPSKFTNCADCPVEKVTWEEVIEFIDQLNEKTGYSFRLPTEAEWEFAARGGNGSGGYVFSGSNEVDSVAWYLENSASKTHAVGLLQSNELGIYDMSGNVLEWCSDHAAFYNGSAQENPNVFISDDYANRIIRGGSWYSQEPGLSLTQRISYKIDLSQPYIGFRLVRSNTPRVTVAPIVGTPTVDSISFYSAIITSEGLDDGGADIIERGVVWSTESNPDLNDPKFVDPYPGTSPYTITIGGLSADTKYYIRSYAINEVDTSYGIQTSFSTLWDYTFDMVEVDGGTFTMGCTDGKNCSPAEIQERHTVNLDGFYIGKFEITQYDWTRVMGSNPSTNSGCQKCPVESVSWIAVQTFIQKLNELSGLNYRLPTEAEWEFAARGGNNSEGYKFSGSNVAESVGWIYPTDKPQRVGRKLPNELGIYDMTGNVREWCNDWYGVFSNKPATNPTGPSTGIYKITRGGSYNHFEEQAKVWHRGVDKPGYKYITIGFRLARSLN
jgi:formylglycine-generating enzyme required for sulfatase activity